MIFASPIWLLGLLPVAAVAVLAFVRPARRSVMVGSLALWQTAVRTADGGEASPARRIPTGWALLLIGAMLATLALAKPTWRLKVQPPTQTQAPSASPPTITFDALAGESRSDGQAEIFIRLRNPTDRPFTGLLSIVPEETTSVHSTKVSIAPEGAWQSVQITPNSPRFTVRLVNQMNTAIASEELQQIQAGVTHVALLGNVSPVLHRYIQADARLALTPAPEQADVVLAQGTTPPKNTPALVFSPTTPPPGWRKGQSQFAVTFAQADIAADDPVMKDVNVAAMAVRKTQPWQTDESTRNKALLMLDKQAVVVRTTPENDPTADGLRRVYVAFSITADNTNIEESPGPFITLLANAIRWLHPAGDARTRYVCATLERGAFNSSWHLQEREDSKNLPVLVGALAEKQKAPTSSNTSLKVPRDQTHLKASMELAPWLIAAAMLCWILGWWRSSRKAV